MRTESFHGSRSRYTRGCRCDDCRRVNREYQARWREKRRAARTHRLLHGYWIKKVAT